ncbi:hypothetical protein BJ166DRAFT_197687 [Pestalotiopsis sp. NC0098]|nr:hypothetical protein BJ166DRAFT_197687 [Pestalotiopsis sp. NC0098]
MKLCEFSEIGAVLTESNEGGYFNAIAQWFDMFERSNQTDSSQAKGSRYQIRRALLTSDDDTEEEVGGFDGWQHFAHPKLSNGTPRSIEDLVERSRKSRALDTGMRARCTGRRLMLTTEGKLVMGPARSLIGDSVVWLDGSLVPFVLRKAPLESYQVVRGISYSRAWTLVGECYAQESTDSTAAILEDLCRPCLACKADRLLAVTNRAVR